jgi:hypothetical protein
MPTIAIVAGVGFVVLAIFQAALAFGAPFGRAAWGGTLARLPVRLRVASATAVPLWLLAALVLLGRSEFRSTPVHGAFARWGTLVLIGLLAMSALANLFSRSPWERFVWGPVALFLAGSCLLIVNSGPHAAWG